MTDNQLYTVVSARGQIIDAHLTADDAAIAILEYDGGSYAFERDDDGDWMLLTKSLNGKWDRRHPVEFSLEKTEQAATAEMFRKVISRAVAGEGWGAEAIPDEQYESEALQMISDADDDDRELFQDALDDWRATMEK